MVTITLQFTAINVDGRKIYKPSSKMSQLFCLVKNVDVIAEEELRQLSENGYQIVIEENDYNMAPDS